MGDVNIANTTCLNEFLQVSRSPRGGMAAMDKKSVAALSMKMGTMEQKHPAEQERLFCKMIDICNIPHIR